MNADDLALALLPPPTAGIENLLSQLLEATEEKFRAVEYNTDPDEGGGVTPIEKLFFAALLTYVLTGFGWHKHVYLCKNDDDIRLQMERFIFKDSTLFLRSQYQLPNWRVDFLINAYFWNRLQGGGQWQALIVECDGHDFHERTKEQAARDRARDREAQMLGMTVFRFTGAELVSTPWACAKQVCDWAEHGAASHE